MKIIPYIFIFVFFSFFAQAKEFDYFPIFKFSIDDSVKKIENILEKEKLQFKQAKDLNNYDQITVDSSYIKIDGKAASFYLLHFFENRLRYIEIYFEEEDYKKLYKHLKKLALSIKKVERNIVWLKFDNCSLSMDPENYTITISSQIF